MEARKIVWLDEYARPQVSKKNYKSLPDDVKYIRSDLVDKLIGYAVHDGDCDAILSNGYNKDGSLKYGPCTCGLSDLIKEVRG